MGRLDGKVAIITGGARGQGRSNAVALAQEGAAIVFCDLGGGGASDVPYELGSEQDMDETVALVERAGQRCVPVIADVTETDAVQRVVDTALTEFGQIDILSANAGVISYSPVAELTDRQWNDVVAVNLTGAFKCMRAVLAHMIERKTGSIVATSSMAGKMGFPNVGHYSATKWGEIGLIKSIALEAAPFGVRANAICPTMVQTAMIDHATFNKAIRPDLENPTAADAEAAMRQLHPMGIAYVEPRDIAAALVFLCSEDARYITGETISVAAGWNASNAA